MGWDARRLYVEPQPHSGPARDGLQEGGGSVAGKELSCLIQPVSSVVPTGTLFYSSPSNTPL